MIITGILISTVFFMSCNPHAIHDDISPLSHGSDEYTLSTEGINPESRWWETFNDKILDALIEDALYQNLTLKQFTARIERAIAANTQASSFLYPELNIKASGEEEWTDSNRSDNSFSAGAVISWEVDLWKRLSSSEKAAAYEVIASQDELEAAAIILTAQVAETYYEIVEQSLQLKLLEKQMEAGETLLELIELRFGYGEASVVDVFQQRQQLASTLSQVPVVQSDLRTLKNSLYTLLGRAPSNSPLELADNFPQLPELPHTGVPADLLRNRPDLRRIYNRLMAADYRIAEAVADRFPKIDLTAGAAFRDRIATEGLLLSLLIEAAAPVIDWDRRESEVDKREAIFMEELARYSNSYLTAIEEVENALWQEKYQHDLLKALRSQISIARSNLTESGHRYQQGLTDYLPVLAALQSLQRLERDILTAQRRLVSFRILLYRALGGSRLTGADNALLTSSERKLKNTSEGNTQ
jgi:NodT family efflux transporter outer membrane factor (OMF) lipoprotein